MSAISSERYPSPHTFRWSSFWQRYGRPALVYAVLMVMTTLFLLPFYILFRNAFLERSQMTGNVAWRWLPFPPSFVGWKGVISRAVTGSNPTPQLYFAVVNSFIIAVFEVIGGLTVNGLAGYGIARLPGRLGRWILALVLGALIIPTGAGLVISYLVVNSLGGVNTLWGVIVPGLASAFSVFIFRQYFLDFPSELEEAGLMDGLDALGVFWRVVLPNSTSIFAALGLLGFIGSWNSFQWPLVILGRTKELWTLQIMLSTFMTEQVIRLPELFVGAVITTLPIFVIFFVAQRYVMEGFRYTGIKG